jgi:hypothetical protein
MKKHSYGKLIGMSWSWVVQVLFRPFSLKKWIMLAVIIILAGQMGGGFNFNFQGNAGDFRKILEENLEKASLSTGTQTEAPASSVSYQLGESEGISVAQEIFPQPDAAPQIMPALDRKTLILISSIGLFIFLFILVFSLLWMWISSNFSFVFIDSMVRNDASLRVPFHRNKPQGNSYFRWNIIFAVISLATLGIIAALPIMQLVQAGVFASKPPADIVKILSIVMPYAPLIIIAGLLFFLIAFFVREFILPIMYKKKIGIMSGWKVFLGLLKKNIGEMILFILVKIGLSILAVVISILLAIVGIIILLLIGGLTALLGWLIYAITPAAAKLIILGILILIAIPIFIFLGILFNLFFLPIPVFFRTFSINVLGSIDESLDLFAPKTPEEIAAEGDDAKYKKSMRLLWFALLAPMLIALIGLLLAIAIPNFIRARDAARGRVSPLEEIPAIKRAVYLSFLHRSTRIYRIL